MQFWGNVQERDATFSDTATSRFPIFGVTVAQTVGQVIEVSRPLEGVPFLPATLPGVLTVRRDYKGTHILMNNLAWLGLSIFRSFSTIYAHVLLVILIPSQLL